MIEIFLDILSEFFRYIVLLDEVVYVYKKIIILFCEDRVMKRWFLFDGSSMEGVCGDISFCYSIKEFSK